jgi:hypothetical protein
MTKKDVFYTVCRDLYVEEGYSIPAIARKLKDKHPDAPHKKTIQNWKNDGQWQQKRIEIADSEQDLFDMTRAVAKMAGKNAKENPTPENINSFVRILSVLKYKEQIKDIDEFLDEEQSGGEQMQQMIDQIQQLLGG